MIQIYNTIDTDDKKLWLPEMGEEKKQPINKVLTVTCL